MDFFGGDPQPASPPASPWNVNRRPRAGGDASASSWKNPKLANRLQAGRAGIRRLGSQLQKINLAKMIDNLERDQGLADQLEDLNERIREDKERHDVVRESERACLRAMESHLYDFLGVEREDAENAADDPFRARSGPADVNTTRTYEEWIEDLHPENTHDGQLIQGLGKQVDDRFYVDESDHRRLWNGVVCESRRVAARCRQSRPGSKRYPVDLLNGEEHQADSAETASDPFGAIASATEIKKTPSYDDMFGRVLSTPADQAKPPALDDDQDNLINFD